MGSILMPGLAASNSAIVCFQIGSYCDSVKLAVCHCRTIGCCATTGPGAAASAQSTAQINRRRMLTPPANVSAIERIRAFGARLRLEWHLGKHVEIRLDAETRAFGQQEVTVLEADRNARCAIAKRALAFHLLEDEEIRYRGRQVHGCNGADRA